MFGEYPAQVGVPVGKSSYGRGEGDRDLLVGHCQHALDHRVGTGDAAGQYLLTWKEKFADYPAGIRPQYVRSAPHERGSLTHAAPGGAAPAGRWRSSPVSTPLPGFRCVHSI